MFSAILLQMIKEVLLASGVLLVKPTSSGEIRVTSYSLVRNGARFMWIAARCRLAIIDVSTNGIIIQTAGLTRL